MIGMMIGIEHRLFGPTDRLVLIIGQGTWYNENYDRGSAIAALRRGLDLGMTHIDTSEMYGSGAAEEMVTEAIGGRRKEVFLVSQVLPQHATRQGTIEACEGSLTRLKTEWLDCYLLHWHRPYPPLGDTIEAFAQLRREGKILSWGVSNFDVPDLEEVEYIAGPGRLACNQALYHLQERAIDDSRDAAVWAQLQKPGFLLRTFHDVDMVGGVCHADFFEQDGDFPAVGRGIRIQINHDSSFSSGRWFWSAL
jgi:diketogulonate reductase-like aldo/keto reductase